MRWPSALITAKAKAVVNAHQQRNRHTQNIKQREQPIGCGQPIGPDLFVATCACDDVAGKLSRPASLVQAPVKFGIFKQRHVGVTAHGEEIFMSAENAPITVASAE